MYFIHTCPSCGKKLRFPIDRGPIRVKCPCGYSFLANPDDPAMYRGGAFDLSAGARRGGLCSRIKKLLSRESLKDLKKKIIRAILQYKYNFQNRQLMTGRQRRDFILTTLALLLAIALLVYAIYFAVTHPASVGQDII
jgi:hypothetical protein